MRFARGWNRPCSHTKSMRTRAVRVYLCTCVLVYLIFPARLTGLPVSIPRPRGDGTHKGDTRSVLLDPIQIAANNQLGHCGIMRVGHGNQAGLKVVFLRQGAYFVGVVIGHQEIAPSL